MEEAMAQQLAGWEPELSITGLRFTNVVGPDEYDSFSRADDPEYRRDLAGTYIDARDGAEAVALALASGRPGFETYAIAAPDSGSAVPTRQLAEHWFPGVTIDGDLADTDALISTRKAQDGLGFRARHSWRDEFRG
jgi:nucleoside-diphosphate-sugar epimerase